MVIQKPIIRTGCASAKPEKQASRFVAGLVVFSMIIICGSSGCRFRRQSMRDVLAPPVVFETPPTLDSLAQHINRSLAVNQLESNTLTISSPEISFKLNGELAWERPDNFSFTAYPPGGRMLGTALAAGSNSELFWLKTQIPPPPMLVYARHNEFESQQGPRQILPVSPLWLREALGVVEIDPRFEHQGPTMRADGKLEIKSMIPSPRGGYQRILVMDAKTGAIEQTILKDATGRMIANASQSEHSYYSAIDWSLPHRIDVVLDPDVGPKQAFTIEIGIYLINEGMSASPGKFQPPDATGLSTYDLVKLNAAQSPMSPKPPVYVEARPSGVQSQLSNFPLRR